MRSPTEGGGLCCAPYPNISLNRLEISAISSSSQMRTSILTIWGLVAWPEVAIAGSPLRSSSMSHWASLPVAGSTSTWTLGMGRLSSSGNSM